MSHLHLSMTALTIVLTAGGVLVFGAIALYRARTDEQHDGRGQNVRNKGMHPVTDSTGHVHAEEEENEDGNER